MLVKTTLGLFFGFLSWAFDEKFVCGGGFAMAPKRLGCRVEKLVVF